MVMFRIVLCDDSPADLMVLRGHLEQLKEKRPVDIISYTDGPVSYTHLTLPTT